METKAFKFTLILGSVNILATLISGLIIDKIGRKTILLIGNFFCMIFLGSVAYLFYKHNFYSTKYFILMYIFAFGLSLGPIVWIYIPEILPEKGISIVAFLNWVFVLTIG